MRAARAGSIGAMGAAAITAAILVLGAGATVPDTARAAAPSAKAKLKSAKAAKPGATIRRTKYGIPHILADDYRGLGYGFAYAFAQDNICTIADSYVTVSAERSRWFGPDKSWDFRGNGTKPNNLDSDFFYQRTNESGIVEQLVKRRPPHGPTRAVRDAVRGYVAGYNAYLRKVGVDGIRDPRCRGKRWVRSIKAIDVYRRFYQLASLASQGVAIEGIAQAKPVAPAAARPARGAQAGALSKLGPESLRLPIGSNAYGLGGDATDNGRGMVLGNPHFPWDGAERLYQAQLTIPGKVNVAGSSLYGVPAILIGTTEGLAWSHTVATAFRFTPVELKLVPGDPYSYVVDGKPEKMEARRVTVKAKADGGGLEDRSRTLYRTRYGPMFTSILGQPLFPWTSDRGYAMHDVNEQNFRYLNHFFANNKAQTVREYDRIQRRYQGIPWVNSIAADANGDAYYSMEGAIPNVPDDLAEKCNTELGRATFAALGLPTLDGSRSECDWRTDPDAVAPGIFGPSKIPRLFRRDYTHNGNDSHWLTNPRQPLEGFARIIGDERKPRSLRTRIGLLQAEQRLDGSDALGGNKFSLEQLEHVTLSNRQYAGELWRDPLVRMCEQSPIQVGSKGPVNVSEACPILAAWNVRDELDSRGALLFRRFARRALASSVPGGTPVGGPFARPYDPSDPINTPSGLNTLNPQVRSALPDAVQDLREAGIPLDAPLRDHQYDVRGTERVPIHGGPGTLGVFNAINVLWKPPEGYGNVPHGTSFLMATQFTGRKCPVELHTFVTYGQSENPTSPHHVDYTRAFSQKKWNDVPFCERDILRAPGLRTTRVGARPAGAREQGRRRGRGRSPQLTG